MTETLHFSVSKEHKRDVMLAIDTFRQKRLCQSDEICKGIKLRLKEIQNAEAIKIANFIRVSNARQQLSEMCKNLSSQELREMDPNDLVELKKDVHDLLIRIREVIYLTPSSKFNTFYK
jgi:hypothetical protein